MESYTQHSLDVHIHMPTIYLYHGALLHASRQKLRILPIVLCLAFGTSSHSSSLISFNVVPTSKANTNTAFIPANTSRNQYPVIEPKPSIGEVDPNKTANAFDPSVGACHTVKPAMDASSGTSSTRRAFVTVAVLFVRPCARFDDDDDDGKEDDEREESAASTREGAHATCIFDAAFFLLLAVCAARVRLLVVRYFCVGEFGNF